MLIRKGTCDAYRNAFSSGHSGRLDRVGLMKIWRALKRRRAFSTWRSLTIERHETSLTKTSQEITRVLNIYFHGKIKCKWNIM